MTGLAGQPTKSGVRRRAIAWSLFGILAFPTLALADDWNPSTKAPNVITNELSQDGLRVGGIANSRHNLTMSYSGAAPIMDTFRNNYYEICVYCHTPHGANATAAAPLWNRTVAQRTYELYRQPTSLGQPVTQPGPNSLTCLSCHDGVTAIDSVINMPTRLAGAFRAGYSKEQETAVNKEFLDRWAGNSLNTARGGHAALNSGGDQVGPCLTCHNAQSEVSGFAGNKVPNFAPFVIGGVLTNRGTVNKDGVSDANGRYYSYSFFDGGPNKTTQENALFDDHPIGVRYPEQFGRGVDYNEPTAKKSKIAFFDINGNNHADPNEVRLYDTGDGYEVECGSCHDPHGVGLKVGDETKLIPSFLRVGAAREGGSEAGLSGNSGSQLCLTCHAK